MCWHFAGPCVFGVWAQCNISNMVFPDKDLPVICRCVSLAAWKTVVCLSKNLRLLPGINPVSMYKVYFADTTCLFLNRRKCWWGRFSWKWKFSQPSKEPWKQQSQRSLYFDLFWAQLQEGGKFRHITSCGIRLEVPADYSKTAMKGFK